MAGALSAPVSASRSRKGSPLPAGAVCTSVEIEPAENGGYTVTHRYRQQETANKGKGPDCYSYIEPRDYVFANTADMLAHLGGIWK